MNCQYGKQYFEPQPCPTPASFNSGLCAEHEAKGKDLASLERAVVEAAIEWRSDNPNLGIVIPENPDYPLACAVDALIAAREKQ
jgi:hypothetical protein